MLLRSRLGETRVKGSKSGVERISFRVPGYDCIRHPCGRGSCGTTPGGNHGIHGEEWAYAVTDGEATLFLTVFTNKMPASVPTRTLSSVLSRQPYGADLSTCVPWPVSEEHVREGGEGRACEWSRTGRCWTEESSSFQAHEFWENHTTAPEAFEQGECFWEALEARWEEIKEQVAKDRVFVVQCSECEGTGLVSR
jgi:hypothetical protein